MLSRFSSFFSWAEDATGRASPGRLVRIDDEVVIRAEHGAATDGTWSAHNPVRVEVEIHLHRRVQQQLKIALLTIASVAIGSRVTQIDFRVWLKIADSLIRLRGIAAIEIISGNVNCKRDRKVIYNIQSATS